MCISTEAKSLDPTAGPDSFKYCAHIELKMLCAGQRTEPGQKHRCEELEIKHGSLLPIVVKLSAILPFFLGLRFFGLEFVLGVFLTRHF